jgi:hypothetical protein
VGKAVSRRRNMSLDNTSHPGRPGPDELVPSRYALRVGAIDVLVVSDGVLSLPEAMLGHNADPAVRAAWLDDMFLPPDVLEWALNVVVVRSGGQTILIDAGMGMEFPDLKRAGRLIQRLEGAGIDLASVTEVVLTHMHMDHVGGLLIDGVRDRLRPDLRVHVAAAETKFWESPDFSRRPDINSRHDMDVDGSSMRLLPSATRGCGPEPGPEQGKAQRMDRALSVVVTHGSLSGGGSRRRGTQETWDLEGWERKNYRETYCRDGLMICSMAYWSRRARAANAAFSAPGPPAQRNRMWSWNGTMFSGFHRYRVHHRCAGRGTGAFPAWPAALGLAMLSGTTALPNPIGMTSDRRVGSTNLLQLLLPLKVDDFRQDLSRELLE